MATRDELEQAMHQYEWYHTIDLGHGLTTPGQYDLRPELEHYGLPDSLEGQTVLDVGPGHGFFAFEFEKRGARSVSTVELPAYMGHDLSPVLREELGAKHDQIMATYLHGALGFAIEARGSKVKRQFLNIYDMSPATVGTYDLVFCASVLLHLTDPLRALYAIRTITTGHAIICTGIDTHPHVHGQAFARFLGTPRGQAFWFPTMACLEQMALAAGFSRVEQVSTFHVKSTDSKFDTPHGTIRAFV